MHRILPSYIKISKVQYSLRANTNGHFEKNVSPLNALKKAIAANLIEENVKQIEATEHLQLVYDIINQYDPSPPKYQLFQQMFKSKPQNIQPKGLYIYGAVGGGKTMLMDMFYGSCTHIKLKQRIHFSEFMIDVHKKMHELKLKQPVERDLGKSKPFDPIPLVGQLIREHSWLICFDEFQVCDIADAMILKRLFTELFNKGIVMIATSNRPPDELYKNGLQRSNFLPFIDILKQHCDIFNLNAGIDYRQKVSSKDDNGKTNYFVLSKYKLNPIDPIFKYLCSKENDIVRSKTFIILGREVTFSKVCGGVLDSSFHELCERPLGANDYLHLTQFFHTVIIRNVPQIFIHKMRSAARRFITLIDALYDQKTKVIISADTAINNLFKVPESKDEISTISDEHRILMDDLKIQNQEDQNASIFTGAEEIFAFDRTISRLTQMQSESYWRNKGKNQ